MKDINTMLVKNRIQRVLDTAYNEVPYFNNIINEIIEDTNEIVPELMKQLPVFDKNTILEYGWPNFVSSRYLNENCLVSKNQGVHLERTSGTTGTPMEILWNDSDYLSSTVNHWKFRSLYYRITPSSKKCTTSKRIPGGGLYSISEDGKTLTISILNLNPQTIPLVLKQINTFAPEWLYIQNSILYALIYYANKVNLSFPDSIRYIEYIGEPLCTFYHERIMAVIPAQTANMYGCVETNGISYSCCCGRNHILSNNVAVEIVDRSGTPVPDGETGYMCVTGLHNTAMPMLRYRLNDLARLDRTPCLCGNLNPTIDILAARMPEYLILDDSAVFDAAELFCPFNSGLNIFDERPDDIMFNLKINELNRYDLLVYRCSGNISKIVSVLQRMFKAYGLPEIHFSVRSVKEMNTGLPAGILRMR